MALLNASTWNTLGLGVAASWTALGLTAILAPHRTAELFGVSAFREQRSTNRSDILGFSLLIGSRDLAISFALFALGLKGRNEATGAVILSTMGICAADIYLVLKRHSYLAAGVLVIGSCAWAAIGLGLCGYFE